MPKVKLTNNSDTPQTVQEDSERKAMVTIAPGETVEVQVSEAEVARLKTAGVQLEGEAAAPKPAGQHPKPAAKPDDDDDEPKRRR